MKQEQAQNRWSAFIILVFGILCICYSQCSNAEMPVVSMELMGGSITEHFIAPRGTTYFINKIGDNGKLIYNSLLGVRFVSEDGDWVDHAKTYYTVALFTGDNSVGQTMTGGYGSYGYKVFHNLVYIGGALGAYTQPVSETNPTTLYDKVLNSGITPIMGIELDIKVPVTEQTYLKLHNLITPILSNSSIGLGYSF